VNIPASRIVATVTLLLLFAVPAAWLVLEGRGIHGEFNPCRPSRQLQGFSPTAAEDKGRTQQPSGTRGTGETPPATLNLQEDEGTQLAFGRTLGTKRLDVWFSINGKLRHPNDRLQLAVGDFRRSDDARITPQFILANARAFGDQLRLRLCLERTEPGDVDAGTYVGRVIFLDKRVRTTTVPMSVSLAYPVWPWPTLIVYFVVLVAVPYVWGLKSTLPDDERFFSTATIRSIWTWATSWGGLLAIAAGAAGAAAAFVATYINSPDWGSSVAQLLGLMGATFTAFVTAATITRQGPS
jgi:hypothetical protein